MHNLVLTDKERDILQKAIQNCIDECRQGGQKEGCSDCQTLESIKSKL